MDSPSVMICPKFLSQEDRPELLACVKRQREDHGVAQCVFRGYPATCSDSIRPGIPGHPATPISTLFKDCVLICSRTNLAFILNE